MPKPPASGKKPKEKGPALITDQSLLGGAATTEAGMPRVSLPRHSHASAARFDHSSQRLRDLLIYSQLAQFCAFTATDRYSHSQKRFYRQRAHANPLSIHHLE